MHARASLTDRGAWLDNLSNQLAAASRYDDALTAIEGAVERILPVVGARQLCVPDGGLQLAQTHVSVC